MISVLGSVIWGSEVLHFVFAHSLEKRVREIVHKAFWDCLSVQLSENPPTYDHAIKLVGEIREVRRKKRREVHPQLIKYQI